MKQVCYLFIMTLFALGLTSCAQGDGSTKMTSWQNDDQAVEAKDSLTVSEGQRLTYSGEQTDFKNFELKGTARVGKDATAAIAFHTGATEGKGYEVVFHNGAIDGTHKTGSLTSVRNLYRSLADDGEWFPFEISVRGKNISVKIKDTDVVCYTEPEKPYRTELYKDRLLSSGNFELIGYGGSVDFKDLRVTALADDAVNPNDTMPAIDEQNDDIIKLQQEDFPVIDYHVHCKLGFTEPMAIAQQMNYGINYGVGPNAYGPMKPGEGGYGTMYQGDDDLGEYYENMKNKPFLRGVQGEGRKWINSFSKEMLLKFDYLYTDAMTIYDHKGRLTRTYRPEEVILDIPKQQYMDVIVDQMVKILSEEPADILANAFYIPDTLQTEYNKLWTDERIDRVLDVMKREGIALEISARYKVPSHKIILRAKEKGLKFTFGTNNGGPDFGKLEYSIDAAIQCGITKDDMWFPSMSTRAARMQKLGK